MARVFLQKSRHKTIYYFRRKVPHDLRARLNTFQIYRSLNTSDRKQAIVMARRLAAWSDQLFLLIRTMSDKDFKDTPLGRLVHERKLVWPMKEEIDSLKEQLL